MKINRRILALGSGLVLTTLAIAATTPTASFFTGLNKVYPFSEWSKQQNPTPPQKNVPPDFGATSQVGKNLAQGLSLGAASVDGQIGAFANYDVYTPTVTNEALVLSVINTCSPPGSGTKNYGCNFGQLGAGSNVLVNSLLGVSAYANDTQRQAAFNFITNMTNMSPIAYPGDDKVFKNPKDKTKGLSDDGVSYFALAFKQLPSLSTARHSLLNLFSERERFPGLAGSLPIGSGGAASVMEVLEYEATRRYMSPEWFNYMNSATDQAVMREMAYMMAFQNFMMVKSYEQNERMEALLVAQINALNNLTNQGASASTPASQQSQQQKVQNKS